MNEKFLVLPDQKTSDLILELKGFGSYRNGK